MSDWGKVLEEAGWKSAETKDGCPCYRKYVYENEKETYWEYDGWSLGLEGHIEWEVTLFTNDEHHVLRIVSAIEGNGWRTDEPPQSGDYTTLLLADGYKFVGVSSYVKEFNRWDVPEPDCAVFFVVVAWRPYNPREWEVGE